MNLTDEFRRMSGELIKDPRVIRLLQNEQFIKAMVTLVQVPGKLNSYTAEQVERLARALRMPTPEDHELLVRRLDKLEAEVEALRRRVGAGGES